MEIKERRIYTLDDIAKELGVSKTTVSRAISGKGRISKETRERVQRFIQENDYQPNAVAKGLAQKKTYNLALVHPADYASIDFPFFRDCTNGICKMASRYNYDIIISMIDGEDLSPIQRLVLNRKVDGIILSRATENSAAQKYLKDSGMPYLVIGLCPDESTVSVDNKNQEASQELTEIMLMKGIRRIALFGGKESHNVTQYRYQGFVSAHERMKTAYDKELIMMNIENQVKVLEAVQRAVRARADGILCMDDFITDMTLSCLREKGIHVPEELKLASLYDSMQLENNIPSVTSVRFNTVKLGEYACFKLLKLLGEDMEQEEFQPGYQVILRESTK